MDDKEKRLKRQFTVTWFLLLIMIIILIFMYARGPKVESHNFIGQKGETGQVGAIGQPGPQGLQGIQGETGDPGQTTIIENNTTVIQKEPIVGEKGAKGDKGEKGEPAPRIEIQLNPATRNLEVKYSDTDLWNVLVPCEQLLRSCTEEVGGQSFN